MVDYDEIDNWKEHVDKVLSSHISENIKQELISYKSQYIEDACDQLFRIADREKIIDAILNWILSTNIIGYHGSRLTDNEVLAIQEDGLIPLHSENRRERLTRALSKHHKWLEVKANLGNSIQKYGQGCYNGKREGQVHITLSRTGLTNSFNHYLRFGSEFDQRLAVDLLGAEGKRLLEQDGIPRLIRLSIPGSDALTASHPYFSVDDLRNKGDLPNLVKEFIIAWAFKINNPSFQSRVLQVDCGMIFYKTIPPSWILNIETIFNI